ncbi:ubiquinone anaerobic biosynthesis accessory factor UbiT [Sodalis sp. RH21]|uniref:ubiquinone anaerobic biosynthesis accessory factor UbiT n=1 Tax=unclassified Sodalis (in: enterobacteria) TaxID=2636512 RepID=UPI0039B6D5CB
MLDKLRARLVRRGPSLLRLPIKFTPFALQRQLLEQVLRWQFREALAEGDLAFLAGRWLKIEVSDLGLQWYMTLEADRLVVSQEAKADVSFTGNANDLILIAARKEDPDTLFFQRRLRIEGDTELGLYVKNLMDSIDLDTMPALLRTALLQMAGFIEAGLKEGADAKGIRVSQPC